MPHPRRPDHGAPLLSRAVRSITIGGSKGHGMPYYVVNAGRGRSTHIMESKSPSTPGLASDVIANLLWFGGTIKDTLCGLPATRHVNVFTPAEASCRECRKRWQLAVAPKEATRRSVPGLTPKQSEVQVRRAPKASFLIRALKPGDAAKTGECTRCGRMISGPWAGKHWPDGVHLSFDRTGYCPGPGKAGDYKPPPSVPLTVEDRRWTAAWRPDATAMPQAIGDYPDVATARRACEVHAGHPLGWFAVPQVPKVVTAAIDGNADYAVVDQTAKSQRGS